MRVPTIARAPHPIAHALHPEGISKTNMMAESVNCLLLHFAELSQGGRIKPLLNYCGKRVLPH